MSSAIYTGMKALCDTYPREGLGGVSCTGKAHSFYGGGYGSTGSMGAMPLGVWDHLPVKPAVAPLSFCGTHLTSDVLETNKLARCVSEEHPSPKSVMDEQVAVEEALKDLSFDASML